MTLLDCGHEPTETKGCGTGYGKNDEGETQCYACCAKHDKKLIEDNDKITLYLTCEILPGFSYSDGKVSNWPGTLEFKCRVKSGGHNIAGSRYDVWFQDHTGAKWHGVQYGDSTQLCHCKKLKNQ